MVRTTFRTIRLGLIAAFMATALAGCAARERAETLFLYQHRLLIALISTIDTIEPYDLERRDQRRGGHSGACGLGMFQQLPDPSSLTELASDHYERYRG